MHATVRPNRIDILGAGAVAKGVWEPLLNELKAEHVPSLTPTGKRMSVVLSPNGRLDAFIYRTNAMPETRVIRILGKYGIQASVGSEDVASVAPTRDRLPEESEDEPRG
jgi:hypothetical protein